MLKKLSYTYSSEDRTLLMDHLKDKGKRRPKNWTLLDSQVCEPNELKFDVKPLLIKLNKESGNKFSFAIDIVSNPNEESNLDFGQFRVRYRYGIANDHIGEQLIKDNTREFCSSLVRARKIYRREDISIMSFRGANPIAKRNYSIFKLKGHWNCRHAWIREVFVIERDPAETENNPIAEKTTLSNMKKELKEALSKFSEATKEMEFTKEDIIEVNKVLLGKQAFEDIKVDDKILRLDGGLEEGVAVSWIGADGEVEEVPNGEITLAEEGKVLTITDGKISAIVDVEKEAEEEEEREELSADDKTAALIATTVAEAVGAALAPLNEKFSAIEERIDKVPAFKAKGTKNSFKAEEDKGEEKEPVRRRPNLNSKFSRPGEKKED